MAQDVLDVKLSELRDAFDRLELRIRLSETVGHDRLQQDIEALRRECGETERNMQSKLLSSHAALAAILASNPGGDRVEIFVEQSDGQTMRAEIPARVNARSIPLIAETKAIVGDQGRVAVV